jgi:hypothetical protein
MATEPKPWELTKAEFKQASSGYRRKWQNPPRLDDPDRPIGMHERFVREAIRRGESVPARVLADYPRYLWGPKLTRIQRLCSGRLLYVRGTKEQLDRCVQKHRIDFTLPVWSKHPLGYEGLVMAGMLLGDKMLRVVELTHDPYGTESGQGYDSYISKIADTMAFSSPSDRGDELLRKTLQPWLYNRLQSALSRSPYNSTPLYELLTSRRITSPKILPKQYGPGNVVSPYYLEIAFVDDAKLRSFCTSFVDSYRISPGRLIKRPDWWPEMIAWASKAGSSVLGKKWKANIDPESEERFEGIHRIERYDNLIYVAAAWSKMKGDDAIIIPPDRIWVFRPGSLRVLGEAPENRPLMLGDEVADLISLGIPVDDDVAIEVNAKAPDLAKSMACLERTEQLVSIMRRLVDSMSSGASDIRAMAAIVKQILDAYQLTLLSMAHVARALANSWGRVFFCAAGRIPMPQDALLPDPVDAILMAWSETMSYERLQRAESTKDSLSKIGKALEEYRSVLSSSAANVATDDITPIGTITRHIYYKLSELPGSNMIGWPYPAQIMQNIISMHWGALCQD